MGRLRSLGVRAAATRRPRLAEEEPVAREARTLGRLARLSVTHTAARVAEAEAATEDSALRVEQEPPVALALAVAVAAPVDAPPARVVSVAPEEAAG